METTPLLSQNVGTETTERRCYLHRVRRLVEPVMFLYWLYMSSSIPLISQFVHHLIEVKYNTSHIVLPCVGRTLNTTDFELADKIQSESSDWLLYLNLGVTIPGLLSSIILGAYSEKFGRRQLMFLPLLGAVARVFSCISVLIFHFPMIVLVIGAAVEGLLGMSYSMLMLCFSYLTDTTDTSHRSFRVVLMELCMGLATVVSHLATGYLIKLTGYLWTFVVLVGVVLIAFLYVVFILEESLELEPQLQVQREDSEQRNESPVGFVWKAVSGMVNLYIKADETKRAARLRFTALLLLIIGTISLGRMPVQTLFILAYPFCMSSVVIGYYFSYTYIVTNICSVIATKLLVPVIGDLGLIMISCLFGVSYQLVFGLSVNQIMLFLAVVAGCCGSLAISLLRSYNSKIVDKHYVGMMFVSMGVLETVCSLVGGTFQAAIYAATAAEIPYLIFVIGAGFYLVAAIVTLCAILFEKSIVHHEVALASTPDGNKTVA